MGVGSDAGRPAVSLLRDRLGAARAWLLPLPVDACHDLVAASCAVPARRLDSIGGNPVRVGDLRSACRASREGRCLSVVDNSLATSALCSPCALGADACVESLDATLGLTSVRGDVTDPQGFGQGLLPEALTCVALSRAACASHPALAAALDDASCSASTLGSEGLLSRGLATLDARMRSASDAAQVVACYLRCHPRVSRVSYPGLASDPSRPAAASVLHGGFGPVVDLLPARRSAAERATGAWTAARTPDMTSLGTLAVPGEPGWLRLAVVPLGGIVEGVSLCLRLESVLADASRG